MASFPHLIYHITCFFLHFLSLTRATQYSSYLLDSVYTCCLAAGGAPNMDKLKLFRVALEHGKICSKQAEIKTSRCVLRSSHGGLHFTNLPLLNSQKTPQQYKGAELVLQRLKAAFSRSKPHFLLGVRCIIAFALSKLDYLHSACPPMEVPCKKVQTLMHQAIRALLHLPFNSPTLLMQLPMEFGGLGPYHLYLTL